MNAKKCAAALCAAALCIGMFSASFAETPAEKVERLRQESAAAEENVEAHEAAVQTAANQKEAYTQKVQAIQQQIEIQKQLVIAQQDVLDAACKATADKLLETERTRALFEDRLVAMYIRHNNSDLATLLSVSTFAEAVRYIDNLRAIAQSDTELLETLRKQSEELAARQAEEEAAYQQLQADQAALEQQGAELADALQKAEAAYSKEQADLAAAQATATQTGEELKKAEEEYAAWVAQNDNSSPEFTDGVFQWPLPGYTRVSSPFGWRTLNGKQDFHRGIDLPAPQGTRIYAAAGGVVSFNAHSSYGNCVKISHGGGLVTIYAHMTAHAESLYEGCTVQAGDLVGYVGNTGNSYGNHLHFEADLNGQPVSVYNYLG